jgi:hypothetical protein
MAKVEEKKDVYELLFGVNPRGSNLFSAKVVKMKDGRINEWKQGVATSLGHAVNIAEDIMGAYVIQAHEKSAAEFYDELRMI